MRSLISILCVWCAVIPVVAQNTYNVSGIITDDETRPLYGAHIILIPSERVATTNEEGHYMFSDVAEGDYTIRTSYIGFRPVSKSIRVNQNHKLDFKLAEAPMISDEVVVQALRATVNTGTTYENLDKEKIMKENTGQDLPYLMQMTPSVVVTSDAGHGVGYTGMRIRGSDATRINATINGIPYNDAESQGTFWVNLPDFASSAESIQIQRGVGTSTNGAGAFGASLNINTNALHPESYIYLNNGVGSFGTIKNTVALGSGLINDQFVMDARLSRIKSDGYIDRASSDLKSLYLSGGWYGDRDILRFNLITGKEKTYQAWNGIPEDILKTNRTYNEFEYEDQTDNYNQTHFQLHYSTQLHSDWILSLSGNYTRGKGYYEEYKEDQSFTSYNMSPVQVGDTTITTTDLIRRRWLDNHFYGLTSHIRWTPNTDLDFTLGGAFYQYVGDHYGEVIWSKYASDSFIYDRYYFNDALKNDGNTYLKTTWTTRRTSLFLDLQARFLYYSFLGLDRNGESLQQSDALTFFNPKLGFTYRTGTRSQWYASIAKASREPNRDDYTDAPAELRPEPEDLYDLEAGFRYNTAKHHFSGNIYYMKYVNQLVLTGAINDVGTYVRSNVKNSYRMGVEMAGSYMIHPRWQIGGNMALSRNRIPVYEEYVDIYDEAFEFQGQMKTDHKNTDIAFSPSMVAAGELRYAPVKNISMTWETKYVSRQYMDNTSQKDKSIAPFSFSNIRLAYDSKVFSTKRTLLALDLKNIFGTQYETNGYTFGYIYNGERADFNFYYPQAGFHFMLTLNVQI